MPNRRLPENPKSSRKLKVRLWEDPETLYELRWGAIEKIDLFEQLILKKAVELMREGKREEAFDYLTYLQDERPHVAGPGRRAMQDYLYAEACLKQTRKTISRRFGPAPRIVPASTPAIPRVAAALGAATGKLVEQYVAKNDYASARTLVASLAQTLSATGDRTAVERAAQRRSRSPAGRPADRRSRPATSARPTAPGGQIARIWPDLPGAKEAHRRNQ